MQLLHIHPDSSINYIVIFFYRLIPSTATLSYEDPVPIVPAPPPGYESGFPITEDPKGSSEKCSTTEVESRL